MSIDSCISHLMHREVEDATTPFMFKRALGYSATYCIQLKHKFLHYVTSRQDTWMKRMRSSTFEKETTCVQFSMQRIKMQSHHL